MQTHTGIYIMIIYDCTDGGREGTQLEVQGGEVALAEFN